MFHLFEKIFKTILFTKKLLFQTFFTDYENVINYKCIERFLKENDEMVHINLKRERR